MNNLQVDGLYWDPFAGDRDYTLTCVKTKRVKTRAKHECFLCGEGCAIGSELIHQKGRVEDEFYSCYAHEGCIKDPFTAEDKRTANLWKLQSTSKKS